MNDETVTLLPPPQDQSKSPKDAQLEALLEAGKIWLGNQQQVQLEQLALERERLATNKWAFRHRFWLITAIVLAVFAVATGLIFAKGNVDSGMTMLSHVAALFAGMLGGVGLERVKKG